MVHMSKPELTSTTFTYLSAEALAKAEQPGFITQQEHPLAPPLIAASP